MQVYSERKLRDFWKNRPDAEGPLEAWYREVRNADWKKPSDIKAMYGSASILKGGRVVFNIGGNKYRLVVQINYAYQVVYILFIGTHKQYDTIDAEEV